MFVPLTLFVLSGAGMIFLIIHKRLELAHGKGLIVRDIWHDLDHKVHIGLERSRGLIAATNAQNFFKWLHAAFTHFVHLLLATINWMQFHLHHFYMKLRHEKPRLDGNTSASIYLKQMNEAKNKEQGAEIE
ncbi:MAG TPA: hypothetical protein VMR73_00165 [Candidatus Paceibacterota bacterium]|nr:hypothetical protein [Candidatus Paceibacterota bacterium]